MTLKRMDNVLIVVEDLEAAKAFFVELGMELEGEMPVEGRWVDRIGTLTDRPGSKDGPREITVRVSLAHPFMQRFCRPESSEIEALERVAAALALAEITARDAGVPQYGTIRRNVNQLLRDALSKP